MTREGDRLRFPGAPRGQRHLFAVCRFEGLREGIDPTDAFTLTRGYWSEGEANQKGSELNARAADDAAVYFVLPVRVADWD